MFSALEYENSDHRKCGVITEIKGKKWETYFKRVCIEPIWLLSEENTLRSSPYNHNPKSKMTWTRKTWGFNDGDIDNWVMKHSVGNRQLEIKIDCLILFIILEFLLNDDHLIWLTQRLYIFLWKLWMYYNFSSLFLLSHSSIYRHAKCASLWGKS